MLVQVVSHNLNDFEYNLFLFLFLEADLREFINVLNKQQSKLYDLILVQNS